MKKAHTFLFFITSIFLLLNIHQNASAAAVPAPVGDIYVQDFANVLNSEEKKELVQLGTYLGDHTGAQIGLLTVPSLGNKSVEEYALEAFRIYGLGDNEKNNGVLLLLAIEDRKIRIEVGYGLEGPLPDGKVGRILDIYALPYLEDNDINSAIMNTYKQLFNEIATEYNLDLHTDAKGFEYGYENNNTNENSPSIFSTLIFLALFIGFIFLDFRFFRGAMTFTILRMLSRGGRGGGGPRGGGGGSSGGGGASRGW